MCAGHDEYECVCVAACLLCCMQGFDLTVLCADPETLLNRHVSVVSFIHFFFLIIVNFIVLSEAAAFPFSLVYSHLRADSVKVSSIFFPRQMSRVRDFLVIRQVTKGKVCNCMSCMISVVMC